MASTRKSRNVNKRFTKVSEEWPDQDGTGTNKSRMRKKKISDMLGPQWTKEELERFYEAYRKHGRDWKKVAGAIRNSRSADMVEALYNMNRAYLSLPEGTATAAGLTAMMIDHYNILEGSNSDHESNDQLRTPRKPQKRGRGKFKLISKGSDGHSLDLLQYQSNSATHGCLSLLKKKRSGDIFAGSRPRAVGKRTPRIPVSYAYGKDDRVKVISSEKQGLKSEANSADDEGVHVAALALAEASQRGGSPQISLTPGRRMDHMRSSSPTTGGRMNGDSEMVNLKFLGGEDLLEGSLESREAENADFSKDVNYPIENESAGANENRQKVKRLQGKTSEAIESEQFDDEREACSGTEEGLSTRKIKDEKDSEISVGKPAWAYRGSKKRSRQLFFGDESTALDALQTLADLSLNMLPTSAVESESSVQVKEEDKTVDVDVDEKPNIAESLSTNSHREGSKIPGKKERSISAVAGVDIVTRRSSKLEKGILPDSKAISEIKEENGASSSRTRKRKRKPLGGKISKPELDRESLVNEPQKMEVSVDEGKKSGAKSKRANQGTPPSKQGKLVKLSDRSSLSTDLGRVGTDLTETNAQMSMTKNSSMPTKIRSRRKIELQKALARKELTSPENAGDEHLDKYAHSMNNRAFDLKEKLSHCLSTRLLRRWCVFEWFYSAIDYPWFARSEFVEYLNHVRLGHVPRLTRVEWGVIRSSLGKPRRLSKLFLQEEREKLGQYRQSVRTHYAELRAGIREGLPTDLARPLSVGQRVIACHPKTREIHDGSILTVDRNRCRVQFDRPELGVEFVMDIDCMPLNPSENMPEALRKQNSVVDRFCNSFTDTKLDDQSKEWKIGGSFNSPLSESLDVADGTSHIASNYSMSTLLKQAKEDTVDATMQAKAAANEVVVAAQQAMYSQPCTLAQLQAREADIRALAELTRALDKKEALLLELRHMNEEVSGKQKDGDPIKDLEHFRKQYAMVLLQLRDANDQVASALLYLRQRNAYHGNSTPPWLRPMENPEGPGGHPGSFNTTTFLSRDAGSHVVEIVDTSRRKARTMVGAAVQAMCSLKEGEDALVRIGEALNFANNWNTGSVFNSRNNHAELTNGNSANHEHSTLSEPTTLGALCSKPLTSSDSSGAQYPSELISSCVATLLMIQTCSERQYPPAEVAQILDSALTSLQPCCQQNLPVYREIETCMGIIKNQMLALLPTTAVSPVEATIT